MFQCFVYKMLENSEKWPLQFTRARSDIFKFCNSSDTTVQNPKPFNLLSYVTEKRSKILTIEKLQFCLGKATVKPLIGIQNGCQFIFRWSTKRLIVSAVIIWKKNTKFQAQIGSLWGTVAVIISPTDVVTAIWISAHIQVWLKIIRSTITVLHQKLVKHCMHRRSSINITVVNVKCEKNTTSIRKRSNAIFRQPMLYPLNYENCLIENSSFRPIVTGSVLQ